MARTHALPLLKQAWQRRSPMLLDLALDVIVPPLTTLVVWAILGLAACSLAGAYGRTPIVASWLFGLSLAALTIYVLRGWALSGAGVRGLADLILAPVYMGWKLVLRLMPGTHHPEEWVRTRRDDER